MLTEIPDDDAPEDHRPPLLPVVLERVDATAEFVAEHGDDVDATEPTLRAGRIANAALIDLVARSVASIVDAQAQANCVELTVTSLIESSSVSSICRGH